MKLVAPIALVLPLALASPILAPRESTCALTSATPQWTISNFLHRVSIVWWTPLFGGPVTYNEFAFNITNPATGETRACNAADNSILGSGPRGPNNYFPCQTTGEGIARSIEGETIFFDVNINSWEMSIDQSWVCDGQRFRAQGKGILTEEGRTMGNCDGSLDPTWGLSNQCLSSPAKIMGNLVSM